MSAPLLGMTGFTQGAFLCWGDQGHVGIETEACESHCEAPSSSDHEEHSDCGVCIEDDSCGACIDIPLPPGGATKRLLRRGDESVAKTAAPDCAVVQANPAVTGPQTSFAGFLRPQPPGGDGSIASLRTVILLT